MIKVFYNPKQSIATNSFSPSASKPEQVIADWMRRPEIASHIEIVDFAPLPVDVIYRVHDPAYVYGVINGGINTGFGIASPALGDSLRYTTGSMLAAAASAYEDGSFTISPTSGFHHAQIDRAAGYCTFNGLLIAATHLHKHGAKKIGILDLDAHYGDGTDSLIKAYRLDYVTNKTQGLIFHDREDIGKTGSKYFAWLERSIKDLQRCDVILCQLGADPHINDPLGGLLTTEQMRYRDELVFDGFKGKPLTWNLAGGYQTLPNGSIDPVLTLHRNSILEHIKAIQ